MKKTCLLILTLILTSFAAEPTGVQLLDKIIDLMNPDQASGIMKQTILTTSGETRTLEYDTYMANRGEKSIMRYRSPARVRGNAMLMTGYSDNIWMFNKRTKRVRKLASHAKKQKFEGSDFTYEDMGAGDTWKEDFKPKYGGKEKINNTECFKLKMTPRNDDISYSKMICWLRTSDFFPIQIDYYDRKDIFQKSLYLEDIKDIEGVPTAMKMVMKNHLDNTETVMEYISVTYDVSFKKNFFSERNLMQLH